jgi:hypothetical protein
MTTLCYIRHVHNWWFLFSHPQKNHIPLLGWCYPFSSYHSALPLHLKYTWQIPLIVCPRNVSGRDFSHSALQVSCPFSGYSRSYRVRGPVQHSGPSQCGVIRSQLQATDGGPPIGGYMWLFNVPFFTFHFRRPPAPSESHGRPLWRKIHVNF